MTTRLSRRRGVATASWCARTAVALVGAAALVAAPALLGAAALLAAAAWSGCAPDTGPQDGGVAGGDGGGADDGGASSDAGPARVDGGLATCAAAGAGFPQASSARVIASVTASYDPAQADACAPAERAVALAITLDDQDFAPDAVAWAFDAAHAPRESAITFRFGDGLAAVACAPDDLQGEVAAQVALGDGRTNVACAAID